MLKRPQLFRRVAVERYTARKDQMTLPKFTPPRQFVPTAILLGASLAVTVAFSVVSIPVHTAASITRVDSTLIAIAPVGPERPYTVGQRVFVRRRSDGVTIARGTVVGILASSEAKARLEEKPPALSSRTASVIVETGRETLLSAVGRRVRDPLLNIDQHSTKQSGGNT